MPVPGQGDRGSATSCPAGLDGAPAVENSVGGSPYLRLMASGEILIAGEPLSVLARMLPTINMSHHLVYEV